MALHAGGGVPFDITSLGAAVPVGWNGDTYLRRDAANALAQRNGTNAQTFRVYNTYTDASNYERLFLCYNGNRIQLGHEAAGTGSVSRSLDLIAADITVKTSGLTAWYFYSNGNFGPGSDNSYDIGTSSLRPRYVRVVTAIQTVATTVAALPAAATAGAGARSFVTDATVATFGSTAVGGGTNAVPVWTDGSTWKIG